MSIDVRSDEFLDNSSAAFGLSYSAERAEEAVAVWAGFEPSSGADAIGRVYVDGEVLDVPAVASAACRTPLSGDVWLDHNNRRLEAEAAAGGERLPPSIVTDKATGRFVGLEDRDIEDQRRKEFDRLCKERQGSTHSELYEEAKSIVAARQSPTHRNQGAYDDVRAEFARVAAQYPGLPLVEQHREARFRVADRVAAAGGVDRMDGGPKQLDSNEEYLGVAAIEALLKSTKRIHSGGGRGNRTAFKVIDGAIVGEVQQMGAKSIGSGSSSGGIKSKRRSKPVCSNCHLQACTCGVDASEGAKKPYFCHKCGKRSRDECACYSGRTEAITVKISKKAKSQVRQQDEVSPGEIVESICVAAQRSGLTIAQTLAVLEGVGNRDEELGRTA